MADIAVEPAEAAAEPVSEHHIEAQASLVDRDFQTLKCGDAFAVLDRFGDAGVLGQSVEGLFFRDTRHLSRLELRFAGQRPLLLSSIVQDDNAALTIDLTNPDVDVGGDDKMPRDLIAINRTKFIWRDTLFERIGLRNYDSRTRRFRLEFLFDADFRDLFEVRGMKRGRRGRRSAQREAPTGAGFRYTGLDGVTRTTRVRFGPPPDQLDIDRAVFDIELGPNQTKSLFVTVDCSGQWRGDPEEFFFAFRDLRRGMREITRGIATLEGSNQLFNEVACRATSDLYTLVTKTEHGLYPYAGIPWYSTVFGRDGIITAMMMLWLDPTVARGVLMHLAAMQATDVDPYADAEPGKILHELRFGEMALLGEVPFRRYYGSVDATPLFVMLAGMYFERTGDERTLEALWPNIERALHWIDHHGDRDGDGFVEYYRETERGLANQGWKDSHDAIFHADGAKAEGPIALCEVQGYVYAAKRYAAGLSAELGFGDRAAELAKEAAELQHRFNDAFWCDDIGTYALALDGAKRACRVRTSNAGHALFTGIADAPRARRVADQLLGPDMFTGWGIRTLSRGEVRYNPMSYHNGSVWPHDNALIGIGFARYGFKAEAAQLLDALFGAALYQDSRRLPELFCGFVRRPRRGPTAYPVACSPQAWAAAAPFGLLAGCLGMELPRREEEVRFRNPVLPRFLGELVIRNLQLGRSRLDVRFQRYGRDVTLNVLNRDGDARVVLTK